MLHRDEYVEQAHFFHVLSERLPQSIALQELLAQVRDEVLATTKLPMALDFLLSELSHCGVMSTAMGRLTHYFHPFQTYIISEAESEKGRFDMRVAVEVLRQEAEYRGGEWTRQGVFLYQFETLCRNRLRYDYGLKAVAEDPAFDESWRDWIVTLRRNIGVIDIADMIYVSSDYYVQQQKLRHGPESTHTILFGEKEGRIALANRKKDPLFLFSALQRHLAYPEVPRPKPPDETSQIVPRLLRRVEQLETRLKLLEDEQRNEAIDLTKFYGKPGGQ